MVVPRVEPPVGTRQRPLRDFTLWPRLGASQLRVEWVVEKGRLGGKDGVAWRSVKRHISVRSDGNGTRELYGLLVEEAGCGRMIEGRLMVLSEASWSLYNQQSSVNTTMSAAILESPRDESTLADRKNVSNHFHHHFAKSASPQIHQTLSQRTSRLQLFSSILGLSAVDLSNFELGNLW